MVIKFKLINSDLFHSLPTWHCACATVCGVLATTQEKCVYSSFYLLVVSGRLSERGFDELLSVSLVTVTGQSDAAGVLASGMIDVAKVVQCSALQHLQREEYYTVEPPYKGHSVLMTQYKTLCIKGKFLVSKLMMT